MNKNLLVTLADKNYIPYAKQLFSSVYWNAGWKGDYMLLSHEIPEEDLHWFIAKGILVKRCQPLHNDAIGKEKYPPAVLDIFYLFMPEFKKWKNIVYLDGDIIVRASLDALTKVKGFKSPNVMDDKLEYYFYKDTDPFEYSVLKKRYDLSLPAFNCGVMAFNTEIINEGLFAELLKIFKTYPKTSSGADPTLNLLFYKKWKKLPLVYDITPKNIEKHTGITSHKLKGVIFHLKDDELQNRAGRFFPEWKKNLEKAEKIDLNKQQKGKKWSFFRITIYSFYLKLMYFIKIIYNKLVLFRKHKLKYGFIYFIYIPDRLAGKFGEVLKKHYPAIYGKLKKLKSGK